MENRLTAVVDEAAAKAERQRKRKAAKLAQIEQQLAKLRRLETQLERQGRQLRQQERKHRLVASLKQAGGDAWNCLHDKEKWNKPNVLAVYCCKKALPEALGERRWVSEQTGAYLSLREDRDILLARLSRKEFQDFYVPRVVSPFCRYIPPPFTLPTQFRNDKEIVVAAIEAYPEILKEDIVSAGLLNDQDTFLAYLHSKRHQHYQKEYHGTRGDLVRTLRRLLSKFSASIRGNAALMLYAAEIVSANVVLDLFSAPLDNDCKFAKQLVNMLRQEETPQDRALGRFTDSVRSNRCIVLAFVQKNGRCLRDATESLKSDRYLVLVACQNNASAIGFAAPKLQRQFVNDKDFFMDIFSRWPSSLAGDSQLYNMLSLNLKLDRDIALAALSKKCLALSDLPLELAGCSEFWKAAIKQDPNVWVELPTAFQVDPTFARAISHYDDDPELLEEVFRRFPSLASERNMWYPAIDTLGIMSLSTALGKHAPEQILRDKELMALACKQDYYVLGRLPEDLKQDRQIVEAALSRSTFALSMVPHSSQCLYPDLVAGALLDDHGDDDDCVEELEEDMLADCLWENVVIAMAWLQYSGEISSKISDGMKNNVEFGLAVAYFVRQETEVWEPLELFKYATSERLRSDKKFMMQACGIVSSLYFAAPKCLLRDIDLALVACSDDDGSNLVEMLLETAADNGREEYFEQLDFLETVFQTAKTKIEAHQGFMEGFLCGVSARAGPDCPLSMLAIDLETSVAQKRKIAEYAGVTTSSKKLRMLRAAAKNLKDLPCRCNCRHCYV